MANVTTCSTCGRCYEAGSEEQANEPDRLCRTCALALLDREAERLDPGHLRRVQQEALWTAITRYVTACSGDPSRYGSVERQTAGAAIEQEIEQIARPGREASVVLSMLLDLHDPPSEARRRRHAEDENGWGMAVGGTVRIGRQIIPRPDPCRMCRGGGADEYGAECSDCDGEGYKRAPEPITEAERAVWNAIGREVSERATEE